MNTISVESLVRNAECLFLPSPCLLRNHAAGVERKFDRSAPDAEEVLREVLTAHLGPHSPEVAEWMEWCLEDSLPRTRDTKTAKGKSKNHYNWGAMFDAA